MNLEQIIQMIESDYPAWGWLIRTDAQGYFANIFGDSSQIKFPAIAPTPAQALQRSLRLLESYITNLTPKRFSQ